MMQHEPIQWRCKVVRHAFTDEAIKAAGILNWQNPTWAQLEQAMNEGRLKPEDVLEDDGNLLVFGGASTLWECLIGNGTATAAQTLTFFNNANAHLGVGDSSTAAAATQTDLQAGANKSRKAMEATFPTHTDGTTSGSHQIVFKSSWGTGDANFAWNEWGLFNGSSGGRMLNRKVASLGTKSTGTWTLEVTLSLA